MRRSAHKRVAGAAILTAMLSAASTAPGQTIRIPDFRQAPPEAVRLKAGEPCHDCGRIVSVREIDVARKPDVPPAFQGGGPGSTSTAEVNRVGAVIYLPLGETTEKPFVGGVGTPEMRERFRQTTYEITVQLDDGAVRSVQRADGARFRTGDRVRAAGGGQLELLLD